MSESKAIPRKMTGDDMRTVILNQREQLESLRTENLAMANEILALSGKLKGAHELIRKCNSVVYCDYDNCGEFSPCRQCMVCDEIDSFLAAIDAPKREPIIEKDREEG